MTEIEFQGRRYLLIGTLEHGGAIATRYDYENGRTSFAHLDPDGRVFRFGRTIGRRDEIKIVSGDDVDLIRSMLDTAKIPYAEEPTDPLTMRTVLTCDRKYFKSVFTFEHGKLVSIDIAEGEVR